MSKKALEYIQEQFEAVGCLRELGIENPNMTQVNRYLTYQNDILEIKDGTQENMTRRMKLLNRIKQKEMLYRDLGLREKAEKIGVQCNSISQLRRQTEVSEGKRLGFQTLESTGKSIYEMVERDAETKAKLLSYLVTRDINIAKKQVSWIDRKWRETYKEREQGVNPIWGSFDIPASIKEFKSIRKMTIQEISDTLEACNYLGLIEETKSQEMSAIEKLLGDTTKEKYRKSYGLARAIENGRESVRNYSPEIFSSWVKEETESPKIYPKPHFEFQYSDEARFDSGCAFYHEPYESSGDPWWYHDSEENG